MTDDIIRALDRVTESSGPEYGCACMGPRDGEPVCPCEMQYVIKYNDNWVRLEVIGGAEVIVEELGFLKEDPYWYSHSDYWSEKQMGERVRKMDPRRLP